MLMSDALIERELDEGDLSIEPRPTPDQMQPASVDLRLSDECYNINTDTYQTNPNGEVRLEPGVPYIANTIETVGLPANVAGLMVQRSTLARKGVIFQVGWVDPGFRGTLAMEVINHTDRTVTLDAYDRVAQLSFFMLPVAARDAYDGQYQDQDGATEAGDL